MFISKGQLRKALNEAAEKERRRGSWRVYNGYEVRYDDRGDPYVVARPDTNSRFELRYDEQRKVKVLIPKTDHDRGAEPYQEFSPLVSHPSLFLKFAGLADEGEITKEVWRKWVDGYGVLGLESHDMTREVIESHRELGSDLDELSRELSWLDDLGREFKLSLDNTLGGPRESYASFVREAYKANRLLRIYEAATAKDDLGNDRPDVAKVRRYAENEDRLAGPINTKREAKGWALAFVGHAVQEVISEDCYPLLHQEGFEFSQGWGFHTLLGAMYLQMAWLMTAKEEVRCKWCDRVIAFEQPTISSKDVGQKGYRKPYKTRADKEFCDRRCKDRWHYQNVTKPKRESEREH